MTTWVNAAKRSRVIVSATSSVALGVSEKSSPAQTPAATKPRAATTAAYTFRATTGTSTAPSSASPAAASSASEGARANQSIVGFVIRS